AAKRRPEAPAGRPRPHREEPPPVERPEAAAVPLAPEGGLVDRGVAWLIPDGVGQSRVDEVEPPGRRVVADQDAEVPAQAGGKVVAPGRPDEHDRRDTRIDRAPQIGQSAADAGAVGEPLSGQEPLQGVGRRGAADEGRSRQSKTDQPAGDGPGGRSRPPVTGGDAGGRRTEIARGSEIVLRLVRRDPRQRNRALGLRVAGRRFSGGEWRHAGFLIRGTGGAGGRRRVGAGWGGGNGRSGGGEALTPTLSQRERGQALTLPPALRVPGS